MLASSLNGSGVIVFNRFWKKTDEMKILIKLLLYKAVCRKAAATTGLLNIHVYL